MASAAATPADQKQSPPRDKQSVLRVSAEDSKKKCAETTARSPSPTGSPAEKRKKKRAEKTARSPSPTGRSAKDSSGARGRQQKLSPRARAPLSRSPSATRGFPAQATKATTTVSLPGISPNAQKLLRERIESVESATWRLMLVVLAALAASIRFQWLIAGALRLAMAAAVATAAGGAADKGVEPMHIMGGVGLLALIGWALVSVLPWWAILPELAAVLFCGIVVYDDDRQGNHKLILKGFAPAATASDRQAAAVLLAESLAAVGAAAAWLSWSRGWIWRENGTLFIAAAALAGVGAIRLIQKIDVLPTRRRGAAETRDGRWESLRRLVAAPATRVALPAALGVAAAAVVVGLLHIIRGWALVLGRFVCALAFCFFARMVVHAVADGGLQRR